MGAESPQVVRRTLHARTRPRTQPPNVFLLSAAQRRASSRVYLCVYMFMREESVYTRAVPREAEKLIHVLHFSAVRRAHDDIHARRRHTRGIPRR